MSFIITTYNNEGIVMASDSRVAYSSTQKQPNGQIIHNIGVQLTDTTYKTFLCNGRIGISTCGDASINNVPITGYIEKFIEKVDKKCTVDSVSEKLVNYFREISPNSDIHFLVAGYDQNTLLPIVNKVLVAKDTFTKENQDAAGAIWDGEIVTMSRLFTQMAAKKADGSYSDIANPGINFSYFTLQDSINFAEYAVDITIKTMAFQNCVKTVGGPIDILVIKPQEAFWIQRKELHA